MLKMLGPEQYDSIRNTLAELRLIRRYIDDQESKGASKAEKWSYLDFLSYRSMHIAMD